MNKKVFVAIDSGKHTTKGLLEFNHKTYSIQFRTKLMQMTNEFGMELQLNSYKIEFEAESYILGDMVSEDFNDYQLTKQSNIHKIAIYTALIELLKKANLQDSKDIELNLAINAPINVYKSEKLKIEYQQYIENDGQPFHIKINNHEFEYALKNIIICFEGMGLIYHHSTKFQDQSSIIFDLGGLNTTMCTFQGIRPDFNSMIVSNLGISHLKASLERKLIERYGISISSNDIEQIIKRGFLTHTGEKIKDSIRIIAKAKSNHLNSIINFAMKHNYTFNQDNIIFVGGGSLLLEKEIKETYPNAVIELKPQFANVTSFLKIIKLKDKS